MLRFLSFAVFALLICAQNYWFKWESDKLNTTHTSLATELEITQGKWTNVGEILEGERHHLVETIAQAELSMDERKDDLIGLIYSINHMANDMIKHGPEKFKNLTPRSYNYAYSYERLLRGDAEHVEEIISDFLSQKMIDGYLSEEEFTHVSEPLCKIQSDFRQSIDLTISKSVLKTSDWAQFETDINLWALSLLNELTNFFGRTLYCFPRYQLVSRTVETNIENGKTMLAFSVDMVDIWRRTDHMELYINGELLKQGEDGYWYTDVLTQNLHSMETWDIDFTYTNPLTGEAGEPGVLWKSFALADIRRV